LLIHTLVSCQQHVPSIHSLLCLRQSLLGNGFQRCISLSFHVHVLTGRRPSWQLTKLSPRVSRQVRLGIKHPDFYYCQTVAGLLTWGALSDERTGLSAIEVFDAPPHGPHIKHRFQQSYCSVTQLARGRRREHRFKVSPLVHVRNMLPSKGRCLWNHYLAAGLHATMSFADSLRNQ
jgi:hypothetical protein